MPRGLGGPRVAAAAAPPAHGAPVPAGVVTAVVGFSSSFVVVLAGLAAVGATSAQAASGLLALCVTQAAGMAWLAHRHRSPISLAWSTPGAALLISTGTVSGGWPAAVGAFLVAGLLGTLGSALAGALADEGGREAAAVCFLVAASGVTVLGVGAAFWALLAGLALRPLLR